MENIEIYFNYRNCLLKLVGCFLCYIFKKFKAFPLLVQDGRTTLKGFGGGVNEVIL